MVIKRLEGTRSKNINDIWSYQILLCGQSTQTICKLKQRRIHFVLLSDVNFSLEIIFHARLWFPHQLYGDETDSFGLSYIFQCYLFNSTYRNQGRWENIFFIEEVHEADLSLFISSISWYTGFHRWNFIYLQWKRRETCQFTLLSFRNVFFNKYVYTAVCRQLNYCKTYAKGMKTKTS